MIDVLCMYVCVCVFVCVCVCVCVCLLTHVCVCKALVVVSADSHASDWLQWLCDRSDSDCLTVFCKPLSLPHKSLKGCAILFYYGDQAHSLYS